VKTFAIILVVGILLAAAVPILLRCNRSADIARHEGFTVAGSLRSAIFQLVLQGAAYLIGTGAYGAHKFRAAADRVGARRILFKTHQRVSLAIAAYVLLPLVALLAIYGRAVYAPFSRGGTTEPMSQRAYELLRNYWLLGAVLGAMGIGVWSALRRHEYRRLQGRIDRGEPLCLRCAYDLNGNLSGICPECGTPIESEAARAEHPPP